LRILNFGSLNIDYVYRVPHIVRCGQTVSGLSFDTFAGGKGANQSVALAKAGAVVFHAGRVGTDGAWLRQKLADYGVDVSHTHIGEDKTGHAVIQVDDAGENAIFLFAGANRQIDRQHIDAVLGHFGPGDTLLLQNEINDVGYLIQASHDRGLSVCFNPAPFDDGIGEFAIECVDLLVVNETEAAGMVGQAAAPDMLRQMAQRWPRVTIVLTLGDKGAMYRLGDVELVVEAEKVAAVDTTAAGDTFVGYFLAARVHGAAPLDCLAMASHAAAICVTRRGAMDAIPVGDEVM